jgi:hypothetical protein
MVVVSLDWLNSLCSLQSGSGSGKGVTEYERMGKHKFEKDDAA